MCEKLIMNKIEKIVSFVVFVIAGAFSAIVVLMFSTQILFEERKFTHLSPNWYH